MALKSTSMSLLGSQVQMAGHQVVFMGFQLSNKDSFSLALVIPLAQQPLPSLSMGYHSHIGFESTPSTTANPCD